MTTLERVYACLEPIKHNPCLQGRSATAAAATLFNSDTDKLKIVIAIGRTLDTGGKDDQAQRLFQSTTGSVEGLLWNSNGISGIQLLVLAALYHYHLDEEVRTGRIIGFAARLCLEMGLHRRLTIDKTFPNTNDRLIALEAFCSVYMLERRTGLGQGIPYTIQDSYIDPALFAMDDANPMLGHLLKWTRLAGKTWQVLNSNGENGVETEVENLDYLDFMIKKWYHELPDNLKLDVVQLARPDPQQSSTYHQAVFLLRQDHLRNLIFRPVLQSASHITQHERHASSAVEIAQNSITALSALHKHTHLVTSHPLFFKHLLLTAFVNLLLSVVHACRVFWPVVREEFDSALDLIEQLSGQSAPMMRLWQRVCGLRELPRRLDQMPRFDECGLNDSELGLNPEFVLSLEEFFPGLSTKFSLPMLDLAQLVEYNSDAAGPGSGSGPPLDPSIIGNHFSLPLMDYQFS
ncbi:hypothetical protein FANTH_14858 [Fusarium anthophilum]|uniref:Xylanolytic transcriptional activator regulatory domain-containing protein n=1 Tax=Fusarium anthophilum TaxID=48485 RepID=A0A8H4YFE9_9HYPO|nr:hypothetical protein FANTH_14858 [Fusarium anthophilum]